MTKELIRKEIDINASPEKVWTVLLEDQFNRQWYSVFSEGTRAVTDWKEGSKVIFQDESGSGIVGKIVSLQPNQYLGIEYDGIFINNQEDYDSEKAGAMKGFEEKYTLHDNGQSTHLLVTSDMGSDYIDMMSMAWDKAMTMIKSLAERL